jgi:hypothetical protein
MKHRIPTPDLAKQWQDASPEDRREIAYLAFEAEYDINRPFEIIWAEDDRYFSFKNNIYIYKPQYEVELEQIESPEDLLKPFVLLTPALTSESPHLYEFILE